MSDLLLTLTIRDLQAGDLPGMSGSGGPTHVKNLAKEYERARTGAVEYLLACLPSGAMAGKIVIDYEEIPGAGVLSQFDVHEVLQSCGIGSALVAECERRIRARGLTRAELGFEPHNSRAQALYERLGYVAYGERSAGWDQDLDDGTVGRYETTIRLLRKELSR